MLNVVDRHVIARENNVVRVDFSREPDPPAPCFPGANGLRLSRTDRDEEEAPTANCHSWCRNALSEYNERAPTCMYGGLRNFRRAS